MRGAAFRADARKVNDKLLVLVADDDPDIRQLVRLRLERSGYTVISAQDGAEALELARDRLPDIAILDARNRLLRSTGTPSCGCASGPSTRTRFAQCRSRRSNAGSRCRSPSPLTRSVDDRLREPIAAGAPHEAVAAAAVEAGAEPLWTDGMKNVEAGIISLEELHHVVPR
jgi:CheY-like chemotaxis protein